MTCAPRLILVMLLAVSGCSNIVGPGQVPTVRQPLTVYYFGAVWCEPCRHVPPVLDELRDRAVSVFEYDVDRDAAMARSYGVDAVPVFFVSDGDRMRRVEGFHGHEATLRAILGKEADRATQSAQRPF